MIFSVGILWLPTTSTSATTSLPGLWAQTDDAAEASRSSKPARAMLLVIQAGRTGNKVPSVPFIGNPRVGLLGALTWREACSRERFSCQEEMDAYHEITRQASATLHRPSSFSNSRRPRSRTASRVP